MDRRQALTSALVVALLLVVLLQFATVEAQGSKQIHLKGEWVPPKGTDPRWIPFNDTTYTWLMPAFGSAVIGVQLKEWIFSFATRYLDFTGRFVYVESGYGYVPDMGYLNDTRDGMMMTSERFMNTTLRREWPDIIMFPLVVQPLMFTYNVSTFTTYGLDPIAECIHLNIEVLADIYMGYITTWGDPRILDLNPTLAPLIGNQTIVPIGYYGRETSTYAVASAFWEHSSRFRKHFKAPFYEWPQDGISMINPNLKLHRMTRRERLTAVSPELKLYENVYATFAVTRDTPGGIGYMPFAVYSIAGGSKAQFVVLEHYNETLIPTNDVVMRAYQDAKLDEFNIIKGINTYQATWPVSTVTYAHYVEDAPQAQHQCPKDRYWWMFMRWIYVDSVPQAAGGSNGFMALPDHIRNEVVKRMEKVVCYGDAQTLLALEIVNDHDQVYFDVIIAFMAVCAVVFVLPGFWLCFSKDEKNQRQNAVATCYTLLLMAGALVCYISIVFFYLVPDQTWVCQARQWTLGLGGSLFLGALFVRVVQLHRIYRMAKDTKKLGNGMTPKQIRNRGLLDFVLGIVPALVVQVVILAVWSGRDTLASELKITDDILRTARWTCKSSDVWLWIGLEIGYFFLILIFGFYVAFLTIDAKGRFPHSRWLLITIYNMFLTAAALMPLFATIDVRDDNLFIMVSTGILFVVSSTLLLTYVPRFIDGASKAFYKFKGGESDTTSISSKASTKKSADNSSGTTNSH